MPRLCGFWNPTTVFVFVAEFIALSLTMRWHANLQIERLYCSSWLDANFVDKVFSNLNMAWGICEYVTLSIYLACRLHVIQNGWSGIGLRFRNGLRTCSHLLDPASPSDEDLGCSPPWCTRFGYSYWRGRRQQGHLMVREESLHNFPPAPRSISHDDPNFGKPVYWKRSWISLIWGQW
jgi:hypothetical protein